MAGIFDDELSDDLLEESSELLALGEPKKARGFFRAKTLGGSEASARHTDKNGRKPRARFSSEPSKAFQPFVQPRSVMEASVPSLKVKGRLTTDTNLVLLVSACRDGTAIGNSASRHGSRSESIAHDEIPFGTTASTKGLSSQSLADDEVAMGHSMSLPEVRNTTTKRSQSSSSLTRRVVKNLGVEDTRGRGSKRYSTHSSFFSLPQDNDLVNGRSATSGMSSPERQSKVECYEWPSLDMEETPTTTRMEDTPTTTRSTPFQLESACSSDVEDDFAQVMQTQADQGKARFPSQPLSSEGKRRVNTSVESMRDEPAFPCCLSPLQRQAPMSSIASLPTLTEPKDSQDSLEKVVSPKSIRGKRAQRFKTWSYGQLKKVVNWEDETPPNATVEDAFYFFCAPECKTLDSCRFTRLCLVSNVASGAFTSSDTRRWWSSVVGSREIMTYEQFKSAMDLIASELKVPVEEVEKKVIGAT